MVDRKVEDEISLESINIEDKNNTKKPILDEKKYKDFYNKIENDISSNDFIQNMEKKSITILKKSSKIALMMKKQKIY